MRKSRKILLVLLIIIIGAPITLGIFILGTQSGSHLVFSQLEKYELVTYQQLDGAIASGLHIGELHLKTPVAAITLHQLHARLSLPRLIANELYVHEFRAETVEIAPLASEQQDQPKDERGNNTLLHKLREGDPILPFSVVLNQFVIDALIIHPIESAPQSGAQKINDLTFSGALDEQGLNNLALSLKHQSASRESTISLKGSIDSWRELDTELQLIWSSTLGTEKAHSGELNLSGDRQKLHITHHTNGDIVSSTKGTLRDWLIRPHVVLSTTIDTIDIEQDPVTGIPGKSLHTTTLALNGTFDKAKVTFNSVFKTGRHEIPIALNATLLGTTLSLEQLRLDTIAGSTKATGSVAWQNGIATWQGILTTDNFTLNHFSSALPETLKGQLSVNGAFDTRHDKNKLTLVFNSENLHGELRDKPYSLELSGELIDQRLDLCRGRLTIHNNSLSANGHIDFNSQKTHRDGNAMDMQITIDAPQLSEILENADGKLTASGRLSGTIEKPDITLEAHGSEFGYRALAIKEGLLQLVLEQGQFIAGSNQLLLTDTRYNNYSLDTLVLALSGTLDKPSIILDAKLPNGQVTLQSDNTLTADKVSGKLSSLVLIQREATQSPDDELPATQAPETQWQLDNPVVYEYHIDPHNPPDWTFSQFCLRQHNRNLCIEASGDATQKTVSAKAKELPLAWLDSMMPARLQVQGAVDLEAQLNFRSMAPSSTQSNHQSTSQPVVINGHARLNHSNGVNIAVKSDVMPNDPIVIRTLDTQIEITDNKASSEIEIVLNENSRINGQLALTDITNHNSPLDAKLMLAIPDLSPYTEFFPDIEMPAGQIHGELKLGGRLLQPSVNTQLTASVPAMHIYPLNVDWHALHLRLHSSSENQLSVNGNVKAGDGELTLAGKLDFSSLGHWQSYLNVRGEQALLTNNANQRLIANPDLNIEASPEKILIRGELVVPDAIFEFKTRPGRLSLTRDAIVHRKGDEIASEKPPKPSLLLDILIKLGENVKFLAYGLKTKVRGDLSLNKTASDNLLGQGELQLLDGTYQAYGQNLQIERGAIQFTGDLTQPTIDLQAVRKTSNVKAGLKVSGPVNNLQSQLYSDPSLLDAEILSYLIRGKPLDQSSDADRNYLSNMALSYAVSRSTPVSAKISDWFALDEASISADEGIDSLGFSLGKHLTPDLYVRYGYGVIDKLNKLFTQYRLTDRLYLESEIGEGQSVDLIFKN